jgi:phage shock protein PspC (stress-responsive transcriptional regulator)
MADRDGPTTMVAMQTTDPTTRRGLVRRPTRRLIAGVAGGLADATGTHVAWWRLGFAFLALIGGLGVAIYLILWVVMPRADLPRSGGERIADRFPGMPGWLGVALLGFGALLLIGHFWPIGVLPPLVVPPFARQIRDSSPSFAVAVLLIGLGILLFRGNREREVLDRSATIVEPTGGTGDLLPPPPRPPRPPRRRRERSVTGWLSFGLALAATGITWLLLDTGGAHPSPGQMFALPLAILGLGLLVGTLFGRARWTIFLGLVLIPVVVIASIIPTPITGRYTDRYLTVRKANQVQSTYQQSGGTLVFDFTKLGVGEHPGPIHATVGFGEIQVLLPKGMSVDITGTVGLGNVVTPTSYVNGLGVSGALHRSGLSPIRLTLEVGFGSVTVYYVSAPRKPKPPKSPAANGPGHPNAPGQPSQSGQGGSS